MNAFDPVAPGKHSAPLWTRGLALTLLAMSVGCAGPTAPRTGSGPPATAPGGVDPSSSPVPARPDAPVSPLLVEKRWLDEWFRGTPVVIALQGDNTLQVEVPLAHSFAGGSNTIKPALAAVLDRVATSLRRQPAMRVSVAASADAGGAAALASQRGQQVRDHLVARGVPGTRIGSPGIARAGAPVQLLIVVATQPIARLEDRLLPPAPALAVRSTAAAPAPAAAPLRPPASR